MVDGQIHLGAQTKKLAKKWVITFKKHPNCRCSLPGQNQCCIDNNEQSSASWVIPDSNLSVKAGFDNGKLRELMLDLTDGQHIINNTLPKDFSPN
tara:strand:+ start:1816 stop:2100 length:285 start_codon:yes stop_codon:yes gene_type:complete